MFFLISWVGCLRGSGAVEHSLLLADTCNVGSPRLVLLLSIRGGWVDKYDFLPLSLLSKDDCIPLDRENAAVEIKWVLRSKDLFKLRCEVCLYELLVFLLHELDVGDPEGVVGLHSNEAKPPIQVLRNEQTQVVRRRNHRQLIDAEVVVRCLPVGARLCRTIQWPQYLDDDAFRALADHFLG